MGPMILQYTSFVCCVHMQVILMDTHTKRYTNLMKLYIRIDIFGTSFIHGSIEFVGGLHDIGEGHPFRKRGYQTMGGSNGPHLTTKQSQGVKISRTTRLCAQNSTTFYENLLELYKTYKQPPQNLWNCDKNKAIVGRSGGGRVWA